MGWGIIADEKERLRNANKAALDGQLATAGGGGKACKISYSVLDLWLGQLTLWAEVCFSNL